MRAEVIEFGRGVAGLLSDPDTYVMMAIGAIIAGRAGRLLLSMGGHRGLWAGRAGLALRGSLGLRGPGVALAAVAAAVDGAAFHASMNLYHHARHQHDRASWDIASFVGAMLSFQAIEGARALHLARPVPGSAAGRVLHSTRYFADEAAALSVIGVGSAMARGDDLRNAKRIVLDSLQLLLAMRVVGAARGLLPLGKSPEARQLRRLEVAVAAKERQARRAARSGDSERARQLLKDAFALEYRHAVLFERLAERLEKEGLVARSRPAYSGEDGVVRSHSPEELALLVDAVRTLRLESALDSRERASIERWYAGVLHGRAFTNPLTGRIETLNGVGADCLRHEGSHRLMNGLRADDRARLQRDIFESSSSGTILEGAELPPHLLDAPESEVADELVALWNGCMHPESGPLWMRELDRAIAPGARELGLDLHALSPTVLEAKISRPYRRRSELVDLVSETREFKEDAAEGSTLTGRPALEAGCARTFTPGLTRNATVHAIFLATGRHPTKIDGVPVSPDEVDLASRAYADLREVLDGAPDRIAAADSARAARARRVMGRPGDWIRSAGASLGSSVWIRALRERFTIPASTGAEGATSGWFSRALARFRLKAARRFPTRTEIRHRVDMADGHAFDVYVLDLESSYRIYRMREPALKLALGLSVLPVAPPAGPVGALVLGARSALTIPKLPRHARAVAMQNGPVLALPLLILPVGAASLVGQAPSSKPEWRIVEASPRAIRSADAVPADVG